MFAADTTRAQRVLRLLSAAERLGLDRSRLLQQIELSEEQISDPDGRVPVSKTIRLWRRLANQIEDPDLGLEIGTTFKVKEAGVVGYAMAYSDSVLGALRRIVRFAKLLNQRAELSLEELGDRWRLQALQQPLVPGFRQPIDEGIAGVLTALREISGREITPASLHFNYPRPEETAAHRRMLGQDLHFDEPRAAIVLWNRDIEAPILAADSHLTSYLDELAQIRLDALPRVETLAGKVLQVVWPHLSEGPPTVSEIASELAMSTRSLQRRLREEGTSFAAVVDDLRRQKAQLLLRDPNLAVYEVGYLLGYSDPSTFHRAFRRWEGSSPSQYRAELLS